ncbi:STAS domain-containing protein [Desulfonatronum sp. SC1]|uniref:STAS domain-containing protein n=1 Tax=Desulfonatronum sp. SC1 TaxID=2109626 RepID=UPI000D30299C|nr:STAS domain-containing protein [Desulfonatronum sp. SC1]PTN35626.1 anti-anti-sigma factor [Desulfonatronum sp. SC1]
MQIDVEYGEKTIVLTPKIPTIDAIIADTFKKNILEMLDKKNKIIVLDMSNVKFIDSRGLGSLIYLLKNVHQDQKLVLCSIDENVYNIIKLTKFDKIFSIYSSKSAALQA